MTLIGKGHNHPTGQFIPPVGGTD